MGCGGTGWIECFCAGDFCACSVQTEGPCEGCPDCYRIGWEDISLTPAEMDEMIERADAGDIEGASAVVDRAAARLFGEWVS